MAAFASGSGSASASARDADAGEGLFDFAIELNAECGDIPASRKDLLFRSRSLGSRGGEAEVPGTPPLTQQNLQRQGQSQRGQAGEDGIAMCSMPFTQTQTQPSSPSSSSSESRQRKPRKPQKPRICMRKVRGGGAKLRTPTPSPTPSLEPHPATPGPGPSTELHPPPMPGPNPSPELDPPPTPGPNPSPPPMPSPELDPLVRIVLMIPTAPLPASGHDDILELACSLGIPFEGLQDEDLIP